MNVKKSMYEVIFPDIYITSHIIYYIVPLTIIIVLAIKAAGFSKGQANLKYRIYNALW